jgi:hypothetical protein
VQEVDGNDSGECPKTDLAFTGTELRSFGFRSQFFSKGAVGQTKAWMPAYASILHILQMMSLESDGGMI